MSPRCLGPLGRRDLLLLGMSGLALGCVPAAAVPTPMASPQPGPAIDPRSVIIVGGGLAGLTTALELRERGFEVTVLEAQPRVGGRITTVREPFHDGLHVELGAMHVVADPDLMALFAKVGVAVESAKRPPKRAQVRYAQGTRTVLPVGAAEPTNTTFDAEEIALGEEGRAAKYFAAAKRIDPRLLSASEPALQALDRQSLADHLRGLGASDAYIRAVGDGELSLGEGASAISALYVMRDFANIAVERQMKGGGRVVGGTDRLPLALQSALGDAIVLDARVTRVEHASERVVVHYERAGHTTQLEAGRVVLALPFGVLRDIEISPSFSPMKQRAIAEIPSASVVRWFAEAETRLWVDRGESGTADTDLSLGRVRDETAMQDGTHGIIGAFLIGAAARRFSALSTEERERSGRADLERVHPGMGAAISASYCKVWDEDPYERGAFAWFKPGQLTELGPHVAAAEGRVHFAGDHTSHRPGFMHGAVASALRVVHEIAGA